MTEDAVRTRSPLRRAFMLLLVFPAVALATAVGIAFAYVFVSVPLPQDMFASPPTVLDRHGDAVGTLSQQAGRRDIVLDELPDHVAEAVMAAEDRDFLNHPGVSWRGVARALVVNVRDGDISQGGSTITQQYIKNAVVGPDRTLTRKINEAALAIKMERNYSKEQILQLYLNTIYWGRGAYGIDAAARAYFDTDASSLTLSQAALLAGIIQRPEGLDPLENPDGAASRRQFVLDGMVTEGWLTDGERVRLIADGLPPVGQNSSVGGSAESYFLDAVRSELAEVLGDAAGAADIRVHTTLDPALQLAAETSLRATLAGESYTGAIVSVEPVTGAVRALVGGPSTRTQPFNAATDAYRQAGSAFKPFTLAAHVADGGSVLDEFAAPTSVEVDDGIGGTSTVSNYNDKAFGRQTLVEAMVTSTNTVYVQLQERLGNRAVADMAYALGIPRERELPEVATLTLGVGDVTPLDMAGAYATIAAEGTRRPTYLISKVTTSDGDIVYEAPVDESGALDPTAAHAVEGVLRRVIESGTGRNAALPVPAAGKTGTTNDFRDAWFVGWVPELTTAVWMGNLDNTPLPEITGGGAPARLFATYMNEALATLDSDGIPDRPAPQITVTGPTEMTSPTPSASQSPTATDATTPATTPSTSISPTSTATPTVSVSVPIPVPIPAAGAAGAGDDGPAPNPIADDAEPAGDPRN